MWDNKEEQSTYFRLDSSWEGKWSICIKRQMSPGRSLHLRTARLLSKSCWEAGRCVLAVETWLLPSMAPTHLQGTGKQPRKNSSSKACRSEQRQWGSYDRPGWREMNMTMIPQQKFCMPHYLFLNQAEWNMKKINYRTSDGKNFTSPLSHGKFYCRIYPEVIQQSEMMSWSLSPHLQGSGKSTNGGSCSICLKI